METSETAAPSATAALPAGQAALLPEREDSSPRSVANGVLVAGMHRSGTSAVAHVLAAAGLYPGPADDQMAATIENPRGYAELLPVMHLNDDLLAAKGWLWDAPPAAPEPLASDASSAVSEGRTAIRSVVTRSPWLLKDPRISLLLPEWRKILLDRFVVVFTVRAPAEVAWSLTVRNDMSITVGLALWAAYYRHLAAGLNGLSAVAVDYAALTTDPHGTASALLDALRGLGLDIDADPAVVSDAVSPSLRRATVPATVEQAASAFTYEQVMPGYDARPVVAWEKFDIAPGQPRVWEVDLLDERRARRLAETGREKAGVQSDAARREADELRREADDLRRDADERQRELDGLRTALNTARAEAQRASEQGARLSADLAAERQQRAVQVATAAGERDVLAAQLAAVTSERDAVAGRERQARNVMERMNNEVARAREDNARLMEAAERAHGRATQLQALVDVYEGSTSWRLTSPLRRLGSAVRNVGRRR